MRLKRLVSTLSEKNPKIERIYNEIFSKAFYLNEDYMCDDCEYHIDDIKQVLCDDDVAKMQDYVEENNFGSNLKNIYHLTSFACRYCSVKCFKYLIPNFDIAKDQKLVSDSIAGGDSEIIRYFIQNGLKVDDLIKCIEYHQYEIFDWILQNDLSTIMDEYLIKLMIKNEFVHGLEMIPDCELSDEVDCPFIEYHLFRLENKFGNFSTALVDACTYNFSQFAKHIIRCFWKVDVNVDAHRDIDFYTHGDTTALFQACSNKNLNI